MNVNAYIQGIIWNEKESELYGRSVALNITSTLWVFDWRVVRRVLVRDSRFGRILHARNCSVANEIALSKVSES